MLSTPDGKNDSRDVIEIAPDVVLVARAAADFPSLAPEALGRPMEREPQPGSGFAATAAPQVDTTFRASNVNDIVRGRASGSHWLRNAALAFLLALCGAFATAAWQRYGDEAQAAAANFVPQIVPTVMAWLPWQQRPASAAQAEAAAPPQAPAESQSAPAPQQPDDAAPAATAPLPDSAQALQSMSRDVASLTQQIEGLKASIAQLKAAQEQLTQQVARDMAKPQEPPPRVAEAKPAVEPRPKQLGAPPRPLGTLVHKPKPVVYPPVQAAAAPPLPPPGAAAPPVQLAPAPGQPDTDLVVRPPMPVR
jgi:hypothetical protein